MGPSATVNVIHAEVASDTLMVRTRGQDTVDSSGLAPDTIKLTAD